MLDMSRPPLFMALFDEPPTWSTLQGHKILKFSPLTDSSIEREHRDPQDTQMLKDERATRFEKGGNKCEAIEGQKANLLGP